MAKVLKQGDAVSWNSPGGTAHGKVVRKITAPTRNRARRAARGQRPRRQSPHHVRTARQSGRPFPRRRVNGTAGKAVLATPDRLHPYGRWQNVAQTFDGTTYRTWVDGVLQGEMPAGFAPQGAGNVRIGARMEGVNPFKGAIARIRFTDRALAPAEMLSAAVAPARP